MTITNVTVTLKEVKDIDVLLGWQQYWWRTGGIAHMMAAGCQRH